MRQAYKNWRKQNIMIQTTEQYRGWSLLFAFLDLPTQVKPSCLSTSPASPQSLLIGFVLGVLDEIVDVLLVSCQSR